MSPRSPRNAPLQPACSALAHSQSSLPRKQAGRLLWQRFWERPLGLTHYRHLDAILDCHLDLDLVSAALLPGGGGSVLNCTSWREEEAAETSRGSRKNKCGTRAQCKLLASTLDWYTCQQSQRVKGWSTNDWRLTGKGTSDICLVGNRIVSLLYEYV